MITLYVCGYILMGLLVGYLYWWLPPIYSHFRLSDLGLVIVGIPVWPATLMVVALCTLDYFKHRTLWSRWP